jgi:hypothetical protein
MMDSIENSVSLLFNAKYDEINRIIEFIVERLIARDFDNIVIKPNWVLHQQSADFPIEALVSSSILVDATIQACLVKYPNAKKITVADIPLQSSNWQLFIAQSGVDGLIDKYHAFTKPRIQFLDLRRERYDSVDGYLELKSEDGGDPLGYQEIDLDEKSFLEEVSDRSRHFRVSDYDSKETTSAHASGRHRYLISNTILESDLFINLPKMKTHQKAGITGALKNLVGMNGSKAYLVHHRAGTPRNGGDEFSDRGSRLVFYQVRLREKVQKQSRILFAFLKKGWALIKLLRGISTDGHLENIKSSKFYLGAGSWYGNDSIWRMTYDLNTIILYGQFGEKKLSPERQRTCISILDGILSGEGNGPLQPLPVQTNVLALSTNPFLIDLAISKLMGFDYRKIPTLSNRGRFAYQPWTGCLPNRFRVEIGGDEYFNGIDSIPILKRFIPPPGWQGHIEL